MSLLNVTVKRAKYTGNQTAQLSTYVILKLQNVKSTTVVVRGSEPCWEQDFLFETENVNNGLLIEVWTKGMIWDRALGYQLIHLNTIPFRSDGVQTNSYTGKWYLLDTDVIMMDGEVTATKNPTGHMILLDCRFELPFDPEGTPGDLQRKLELLNGGINFQNQQQRQAQYLGNTGYSEDSDYTSDFNYPIGQNVNSSASQYHNISTPHRSLETSRENSYEKDDRSSYYDCFSDSKNMTCYSPQDMCSYKEENDPLFYNSRPMSNNYILGNGGGGIGQNGTNSNNGSVNSGNIQRKRSFERQTTYDYDNYDNNYYDTDNYMNNSYDNQDEFYDTLSDNMSEDRQWDSGGRGTSMNTKILPKIPIKNSCSMIDGITNVTRGATLPQPPFNTNNGTYTSGGIGNNDQQAFKKARILPQPTAGITPITTSIMQQQQDIYIQQQQQQQQQLQHQPRMLPQPKTASGPGTIVPTMPTGAAVTTGTATSIINYHDNYSLTTQQQQQKEQLNANTFSAYNNKTSTTHHSNISNFNEDYNYFYTSNDSLNLYNENNPMITTITTTTTTTTTTIITVATTGNLTVANAISRKSKTLPIVPAPKLGQNKNYLYSRSLEQNDNNTFTTTSSNDYYYETSIVDTPTRKSHKRLPQPGVVLTTDNGKALTNENGVSSTYSSPILGTGRTGSKLPQPPTCTATVKLADSTSKITTSIKNDNLNLSKINFDENNKNSNDIDKKIESKITTILTTTTTSTTTAAISTTTTTSTTKTNNSNLSDIKNNETNNILKSLDTHLYESNLLIKDKQNKQDTLNETIIKSNSSIINKKYYDDFDEDAYMSKYKMDIEEKYGIKKYLELDSDYLKSKNIIYNDNNIIKSTSLYFDKDKNDSYIDENDLLKKYNQKNLLYDLNIENSTKNINENINDDNILNNITNNENLKNLLINNVNNKKNIIECDDDNITLYNKDTMSELTINKLKKYDKCIYDNYKYKESTDSFLEAIKESETFLDKYKLKKTSYLENNKKIENVDDVDINTNSFNNKTITTTIPEYLGNNENVESNGFTVHSTTYDKFNLNNNSFENISILDKYKNSAYDTNKIRLEKGDDIKSTETLLKLDKNIKLNDIINDDNDKFEDALSTINFDKNTNNITDNNISNNSNNINNYKSSILDKYANLLPIKSTIELSSVITTVTTTTTATTTTKTSEPIELNSFINNKSEINIKKSNYNDYLSKFIPDKIISDTEQSKITDVKNIPIINNETNINLTNNNDKTLGTINKTAAILDETASFLAKYNLSITTTVIPSISTITTTKTTTIETLASTTTGYNIITSSDMNFKNFENNIKKIIPLSVNDHISTTSISTSLNNMLGFNNNASDSLSTTTETTTSSDYKSYKEYLSTTKNLLNNNNIQKFDTNITLKKNDETLFYDKYDDPYSNQLSDNNDKLIDIKSTITIASTPDDFKITTLQQSVVTTTNPSSIIGDYSTPISTDLKPFGVSEQSKILSTSSGGSFLPSSLSSTFLSNLSGTQSTVTPTSTITQQTKVPITSAQQQQQPKQQPKPQQQSFTSIKPGKVFGSLTSGIKGVVGGVANQVSGQTQQQQQQQKCQQSQPSQLTAAAKGFGFGLASKLKIPTLGGQQKVSPPQTQHQTIVNTVVTTQQNQSFFNNNNTATKSTSLSTTATTMSVVYDNLNNQFNYLAASQPSVTTSPSTVTKLSPNFGVTDNNNLIKQQQEQQQQQQIDDIQISDMIYDGNGELIIISTTGEQFYYDIYGRLVPKTTTTTSTIITTQSDFGQQQQQQIQVDKIGTTCTETPSTTVNITSGKVVDYSSYGYDEDNYSEDDYIATGDIISDHPNYNNYNNNLQLAVTTAGYGMSGPERESQITTTITTTTILPNVTTTEPVSTIGQIIPTTTKQQQPLIVEQPVITMSQPKPQQAPSSGGLFGSFLSKAKDAAAIAAQASSALTATVTTTAQKSENRAADTTATTAGAKTSGGGFMNSLGGGFMKALSSSSLSTLTEKTGLTTQETKQPIDAKTVQNNYDPNNVFAATTTTMIPTTANYDKYGYDGVYSQAGYYSESQQQQQQQQQQQSEQQQPQKLLPQVPTSLTGGKKLPQINGKSSLLMKQQPTEIDDEYVDDLIHDNNIIISDDEFYDDDDYIDDDNDVYYMDQQHHQQPQQYNIYKTVNNHNNNINNNIDSNNQRHHQKYFDHNINSNSSNSTMIHSSIQFNNSQHLLQQHNYHPVHHHHQAVVQPNKITTVGNDYLHQQHHEFMSINDPYYDYRNDYFNEEDEYKYLKEQEAQIQQQQQQQQQQKANKDQLLQQHQKQPPLEFIEESRDDYIDDPTLKDNNLKQQQQGSHKNNKQLHSLKTQETIDETSDLVLNEQQQIKQNLQKQSSVLEEEDEEIDDEEEEEDEDDEEIINESLMSPSEIYEQDDKLSALQSSITSGKRGSAQLNDLLQTVGTNLLNSDNKISSAVASATASGITQAGSTLTTMTAAGVAAAAAITADIIIDGEDLPHQKKKMLHRGETEEVVSGQMTIRKAEVTARQRWHWAYNKIIMQLNVSTFLFIYYIIIFKIF